MNLRSLFACVAPALLLAITVGCSSDEDTNTSGNGSGDTSGSFACTTTAAGVKSCTLHDYGSIDDNTLDAARDVCEAMGGTVSDACTATSTLGCCTNTRSVDSTETCYYEGGGLTPDAVKQTCDAANGTYSAKP